MVVLGIDTCGSTGTVALARLERKPGKLGLLGQANLAGKTYSAQLVPSIRALLAEHNFDLAELAAIVAASGPGSFTGIRIGLASAMGLAEVHSIPIVAVSRLAVLAHKAGASSAALDASRHEFYFRDGEGREATEALLGRDAFAERSSKLGSQLAVCEAALDALAPRATMVEPPTAEDAIRFALARLAAREFDDPLLLDGNYIRRSDAEIFAAPDAPARPRPAAKAVSHR